MQMEREKPLNKLLTEPVTRPDGRVVSIIEIWPVLLTFRDLFQLQLIQPMKLHFLGMEIFQLVYTDLAVLNTMLLKKM